MVRKEKTMKTLLTLASLPFLLSSCMVVDLQWEQGNGVAATEIRSLSSFSRVRMDAPAHVVVKTGPSYAAYVTSDANLTGFIQTDAFAGTLTISMSSGILPTIDPEITIIVPDLKSLTHYGDGLVEIEEDGNFPDVDLTLNGSGDIRYYGTASRLRAVSNGSGNIVLEGYAAELEAELRGSGNIRGENMLAGDADVRSTGWGSAFLDLDYESVLTLDLSGPGRVEWWGAPERLVYNLTGSGKVVEHRGLPKKTAQAKTSAPAGSAKAGAAKQAAGEAGPYEIIAGKE